MKLFALMLLLLWLGKSAFATVYIYGGGRSLAIDVFYKLIDVYAQSRIQNEKVSITFFSTRQTCFIHKTFAISREPRPSVCWFYYPTGSTHGK